jgi:hypothetical protein
VAVVAAVLVAGTASCDGGTPTPSSPSLQGHSPADSAAASAAPSAPPSASGELDLAALEWHEVLDVSDTSGNSERRLVFGSLGGTVNGTLPLNRRGPDEIAGTEPYAWLGPQAAGMFGDGEVVVWGRDGVLGRIEVVDAATGEVRTVTEVDDAVQVSTADAELRTIFYVTVDSTSRRPTGLWSVPAAGGEPQEIAHRFSQAPVDNGHRYRLGASDDGRLVVVQAEDDTATVIDATTGASVALEPGGPFIGFAGDELVAMTGRAPDDTRDVAVFDAASGNGRVVAESVSAAAVVATTDGDAIAVLRTIPSEPRSFEVGVVTVDGQERMIYVQDPARIGQLLAQPDRYAFAGELPPGWILLGTSFLPWIEGPGWSPKDAPDTDPPALVGINTGRVVPLGPFVDS